MEPFTKPSYSNKDLQGETRVIVVHIEADEKGSIIKERTHYQIKWD